MTTRQLIDEGIRDQLFARVWVLVLGDNGDLKRPSAVKEAVISASVRDTFNVDDLGWWECHKFAEIIDELGADNFFRTSVLKVDVLDSNMVKLSAKDLARLQAKESLS